ncbi:hypothetical protein [Pseudonocardia alni]|uniref:hypothetical protein n=1 Tax=Pseudonocardia alni TaxID=33907 RepID=UPI00332D0BCB
MTRTSHPAVRALLALAIGAVLALGGITACTTDPAPATPPPAAPVNETDAGIVDPDLGPPAEIQAKVGERQVVNYGGEDVASFTITKIAPSACIDGAQQIDIEFQTGQLYAENDYPFFQTETVDAAGITHPDGVRWTAGGGTYGGCPEDIVPAYAARPGKTYQGSLQYTLAADTTRLNFISGGGLIWSYEVTP